MGIRVINKHGGLFGETGEVVKVHRVYASIVLDKILTVFLQGEKKPLS